MLTTDSRADAESSSVWAQALPLPEATDHLRPRAGRSPVAPAHGVPPQIACACRTRAARAGPHTALAHRGRPYPEALPSWHERGASLPHPAPTDRTTCRADRRE